MQKILVTGASGFIGSNLINSLKKKYRLICIYNKKNFKIRQTKFDEVEWIKADLSQKKHIKIIPKDIDVLIHLAADPRTFLQLSEKTLQIKRNEKITNNVIEYLKDNKCKLFIFFSSCYVYSGNKRKVLNENLKIKPIEALGKSKKNSENLFYKFSKITKQKIIILRLFSVYGKGVKKTHYLYKLINLFKNKIKKHLLIKGPNIKRDYINISDLIAAIQKILNFKVSKYKKNFYIFNISTGQTITNKNIVLCLKKILKSKKIISYKRINNLNNLSFASSNTKFKKFYKWYPKIKFENGLKELV
jgi:nucleoside-diphosphate-sugar epimerase